MRSLQDSLFFDAPKRLFRWSAAVGRHSLVGRTLAAVTRALGRAFGSSLTFGTGRISTRPLSGTGEPLAVLLVSRPYVWLRTALAEGAVGRLLARLPGWARHSTIGGGSWLRLAGAVMLGMGCGRALLAATGGPAEAGHSLLSGDSVLAAVVTPAALIVVGILAAAWGPRLVPALADSRSFGWLRRGARSVSPAVAVERPAARSSWALGLSTAICLIAGAVAGFADTSGPAVFLAGVLGLGAIALLLARPEAVLLVFAAFPWCDWLARRTLGLGAGWDEGLLLGSIALVLWGALVTGRLRLRTIPILLPTLCAFAAAIGSVVVRGVPGYVGIFSLRVVFEPLIFYFAAFLLFSSVRWVRAAVGVFLASSVGLAVHGLYQYLARVPSPTRWVDPNETDIVTRAFSIIGNPNGLGVVLSIGFLVAIGLLLSKGLRTSARLGLGVAAVIQLGGLAVTFSRGAWIGTAVGLFAMLVLAYRRYLVPAVIVGVAGLLATPGVFMRRLLFIFSDTYISKSAIDGRTQRWGAALDHIAAHPWFGSGLGTFGGSSAERFGYLSSWVDNYYLQMGAEGGLLLLAAFSWLLLRVGKGLVKGYRVATDPFVQALCAGVFGAFVATIVANVFASGFETLAVGAAFWFLAGIATAAALSSATSAEAKSE